jgi:ribose transport system substrate-binding protein
MNSQPSRTPIWTRNWTRTATALLAVATLSLAACSSSSTSATNNAADTGSNSGCSSPGVKAAQALLAKYSAQPAFQSPGAAINAASLTGKTVWIIVNSLEDPFNAGMATAAASALQRAGIKTKVLDGQGSENTWAQLMEEAAAQKPAAVIGSGISTSLMKGPEADLGKAGVPFIEAVSSPKSLPAYPGVDGYVDLNYILDGQLQAAYVIANSCGKASVLLFNDTEYPDTVGAVVQGGSAYYKQNCPGCTVYTQVVQIATLPTTVPSDVATIIHAHPAIQWVQGNFDYLSGFAVQGINQAGFSNVSVVSGDGVNAQLDEVRQGNHMKIDVGASPVWVGWSAADLIMRIMLGQKTPYEVVPQRAFTKANIPATDTATGLVSTNFESDYLQLWGVTS